MAETKIDCFVPRVIIWPSCEKNLHFLWPEGCQYVDLSNVQKKKISRQERNIGLFIDAFLSVCTDFFISLLNSFQSDCLYNFTKKKRRERRRKGSKGGREERKEREIKFWHYSIVGHVCYTMNTSFTK